MDGLQRGSGTKAGAWLIPFKEMNSRAAGLAFKARLEQVLCRLQGVPCEKFCVWELRYW